MISLSPGQTTVLKAFSDFGQPVDDVGLAIYVHHAEALDMSSSGVRSRRAELARKGLLKLKGTKRTKSGRTASIYGLSAKGARIASRIA